MSTSRRPLSSRHVKGQELIPAGLGNRAVFLVTELQGEILPRLSTFPSGTMAEPFTILKRIKSINSAIKK